MIDSCCEECKEVMPTDSPDGSLMQLTYCFDYACACHKYNAKKNPQNIDAGDRAEKREGKTFCRGTILAVYSVPGDEELWCVVLIDASEASGNLQHLYPLKFFTKI